MLSGRQIDTATRTFVYYKTSFIIITALCLRLSDCLNQSYAKYEFYLCSSQYIITFLITMCTRELFYTRPNL